MMLTSYLAADAGQKLCDILKNSENKHFVIKHLFSKF